MITSCICLCTSSIKFIIVYFQLYKNGLKALGLGNPRMKRNLQVGNSNLVPNILEYRKPFLINNMTESILKEFDFDQEHMTLMFKKLGIEQDEVDNDTVGKLYYKFDNF